MLKKKLFEKFSADWTEDSIRHFVTPTKLGRSMPYRIQEVGDFQTFFPYYTERANLRSFQIIYSLDGEGHLDYRGMSFKVKAGEIFIINCMEHHIYYTPRGKT